MASAPLSFFIIVTFCAFFFSCKSEEGRSHFTSAHIELNHYGFPVGLLPSNVSSYHVNHTTGVFSVDLVSDCVFLLPPDNYLASFSKTLGGLISHGFIADLHGIRVKAFFRWWSITGIRSSGDDLVFQLGLLTAKYPSKSFLQSPLCLDSSSDS